MAESEKQVESDKVECKVCLKEIPVSEARSDEALGYVIHFCGLECYEKWKNQEKKNKD
ncbi:MAG: DUF3330 domain-containing protein [Gammaproteobacteria bacterium]|nr:DUF3330 domain-containing protein [Gammaproteobacteria bacterium]